MSNNVEYSESSIDLLEGAERIRKRPASVLGSNNIEGARHGITEIYGNASDEASAGYGDRLDFVYYKDGSVSIRDYGRGVPLGWNEKLKQYNWHVIYNELYGGGKMDTNQEKLRKVKDWSNFDKRDYNYLYSVGLNGLGAAATQYTSEFFDVVSVRRKNVDDPNSPHYKYSMHFEKGLPIINGRPINVQKEKYDFSDYEQVIEDTDEPTGTFIHWKPDIDVFTDVDITEEWLFNFCRDMAYVGGLTLSFTNEATGEVRVIEAGELYELLKIKFGDKVECDDDGNPLYIRDTCFNHGTLNEEEKSIIWVAECEVCISPVKQDMEVENVCYHNTIKMKFGKQYDAIEDAVLNFLRDKASTKGVRLEYSDTRNIFAFVLSSYSSYISVRNQTKDGIDDMFIYTMIKDMITKKLEVEYSKGNPIVVNAVSRVIENAQLRVQLKEATRQFREVNRVKRAKNPTKFITCREYEDKKYDRTELWITEGDSAKDSVSQARNSDFQAIYPIRGKGLNVLKASIAKLLKNKEITDIFTLLGTGIDINVKGQKLFNIDDLRFDKIVFATDADVDGYQIRVLLFVIFYRLAPRLLTEGHVFIAETPRYGLSLTDGTMVYANNEKERDDLLGVYSGRVKKVNRYKGLGEVNADILRETTVHPDNRNLIPLTVDFDNELERDLIDSLFGEDKKHQRKEILTTVLGDAVASELMDNMQLLNEIDNEDIEEETEYEQWS